MMTLGSLFSGSGGFELAAQMCGIRPVWASEIEPYPIEVTKKNFPDLLHLGDVTKIDGGKVEPVDIVSFGSPCTNLSISGNHKGLAGEQSSLFFEAVRIINEMRKATDNEYPTFAVWENVPNALSTNKGEDFRTVIESLAGIPIPKPDKWRDAGFVMADSYSLAWRILDAQYFGVPQRRKRVFLVVDFRGQRAGKILFEQEGVSGDTRQGGGTGQQAARGVSTSAKATDCLNNFMGQGYRVYGTNGTSVTLTSQGGGLGAKTGLYLTPTVCVQGSVIGRNHHNGPQGSGINEDVCFTLNTVDRHVVCQQRSENLVCLNEEPLNWSVRKLTPTECARLQGFPDNWGKGVPYHSDSAEYKLWGNGVALPCVKFIMERIAKWQR